MKTLLSAFLIFTLVTLAKAQEARSPIRVAILLYDGVQVLDVAGPLEVFTSSLIRSEGKVRQAFDTYLVAERLDPVRANNTGAVFLPKHTLQNAPPPDILIIPGGDVAEAQRNEPLIAWIKRTSEKAELTASVCTGAFLLAEAGKLSGKSATTHWATLDALARQFPDVRVKRDVRYVDEGKIITSAGVSAGTDMALHIVERKLGRSIAEFTARNMQYEWKRETSQALTLSAGAVVPPQPSAETIEAREQHALVDVRLIQLVAHFRPQVSRHDDPLRDLGVLLQPVVHAGG
jgi:transcriptional regulator GlxA family with amidase domain